MSGDVAAILRDGDELFRRTFAETRSQGLGDAQATETAIWARERFYADAGPAIVAAAERRFEQAEVERRNREATADSRRARLGFPIGRSLFRVPPASLEPMLGERWRGHTIEGWGLLPDVQPHWPDDWWPHWIVYEAVPTDEDGAAVLVVQLWEQVIRAPGTPVYLEVLWHPERGQTMALRVDAARSDRDVRAAIPLVTLARALNDPHRRAGRARDARSRRTAERSEEARSCYEAGEPAGKIAQRLEVTERTIRRYVGRRAPRRD